MSFMRSLGTEGYYAWACQYDGIALLAEHADSRMEHLWPLLRSII
jgi:hypothetical protein